ncbi:acid phosphatase [Francisella adeliensis]|uniref:Acid phosphatase n=2 Tax=Francisella adeliensis TaxID=2007306 RepID=A0ABX6KGT3_9GAMM|nr:phosphatase PAP2 family protein [Francisella adeliensis]MBK2086267.1 phosphatase PAP2 family protein [Francisella adeliensis]MBK2096484.1 phosphatase PAP2 family protein [Francisella adeliensis]QIW12791.1 phosphatase PAP2 family protein [Francisella adeliensis]QIW14669.1 phosphatase PAP2 family protein [Francisella adeliensis]
MNKKLIIAILTLCSLTAFAEDGFLSPTALPDSKEILPPPPSMEVDSNGHNSPTFAQDQEITKTLYQNNKFFNGQPISKERMDQTIADASKTTEYYQQIFIDPLNISEEDKVKIKNATTDIFTKVVLDGNNSTEKAKTAYARDRPYYYYHTVSCQGDDSTSSKRSISYPSGHSTRGMTVAYVLADILPEKFREQILARGMDYGYSRVICGAHWQSDIEAGRVLARSVFETLKENSAFNTEEKKVIQEIGTVSS